MQTNPDSSAGTLGVERNPVRRVALDDDNAVVSEVPAAHVKQVHAARPIWMVDEMTQRQHHVELASQIQRPHVAHHGLTPTTLASIASELSTTTTSWPAAASG